MSWLESHTNSEKLAMDAAESLRRGEKDIALRLYREAAKFEERALYQVDASKARTRGITAVSAVALWFKAAEYALAKRLADIMLADQSIPDFARKQLKDLVQAIEAKSPARDGYEAVELYPFKKADKRHLAAELHTNAAKHHADAAYHHKEAAKHYADGNYEKAGYHAHMAYSYHLLAVEEMEKAAVGMVRPGR
jgi:hypothetical protein